MRPRGARAAAGLRKKLLWLIGLRAAIVTVLLGAAILVQLNEPGVLPSRPFYLLIAFTYGLTATYALTLGYIDRHRWLVDLQLAADAVLVTLIISVTGGAASYLSSLYFLPIIAASIVQWRRGGMLVASLSAVSYAAVVVTQYATLPTLEPYLDLTLPANLPPVRVAAYTLGLNVFGFIAVGILSGSLAEGLRRADARLEQASSEIADLQALSQHIIDSMTSGLATTDPERRIVSFNRAAEFISGHAECDVLGRPVAEILQLPPSFVANLVEGDHPLGPRIEFAYLRHDGTRIELGLSAAPLITSIGPSGFLLLFQDLTEIKKLEREAAMQQRLAAVGEMAAGIAHEIRNPLASMSGSIQILRQELPLTPDQAQLMDIVMRESERLNETIRSFLAYARPQRFAAAHLDLRTIISGTALLLRHSSELGEGHTVDVDLPEEPITYEADEGQIRQILWNLATNGLRAMPDGGRLLMSARNSTDSYVTLSVADEGIGIPAEELDGIFQPFRGAFLKGSGLGLAIVHRIVSDYDGEIQVTSQPGKGTTVEIRLPTPVAVAAG